MAEAHSFFSLLSILFTWALTRLYSVSLFWVHVKLDKDNAWFQEMRLQKRRDISNSIAEAPSSSHQWWTFNYLSRDRPMLVKHCTKISSSLIETDKYSICACWRCTHFGRLVKAFPILLSILLKSHSNSIFSKWWVRHSFPSLERVHYTFANY